MTEISNRTKLIGSAAAIALLAGTVGLLVGRSAPGAGDAAGAPEAEEKEGAGHREGFVQISAEQAQAAGIRTETVAPGALGDEILAQASVTAPPEGRAALTARANGAIVRIYKRLGDPVRPGETIALLESREASTIVGERAAAAARAQATRAALARERRLFSERITARQDLEAAVAANAQAEAEMRRTDAAVSAAAVTADGRHIAIRSLIGGRVTKVDAELGHFVAAGTELFEVSNPNSIQIEASVPSVDAQRINPGDAAVIELPGGATVDAVVRSATPSVDPESRAHTIVLSPAGVPAGLAQGQGVRVRIMPRGTATNRIVLPEGAVQSVEGRDVVFVAVPGGFQAMPVTVGARSAGRVEIVGGLRPGLSVVTGGAFVLKSQLGASEAEH